MSCHDAHLVEPRAEHSKKNVGHLWPKHQKGDSWAQTLERNKEHFRVADLFNVVFDATTRCFSSRNLNQCTYRLGIWHVVGACNRERIDYFGVDVAREFPTMAGILVFPAAVKLVGEKAIHRLRCRHDWQVGPEYYVGDATPAHATHTFFLIPSLDYWERHQGDFVKLAADINAAI